MQVTVFTCSGGTGTAQPVNTVTLGSVSSRTDPVGTCDNGGVWQTVDVSSHELVPVDLELIGITPEYIGLTFGFGFGAVALFWSLGYAIQAAIAAIRKA